MDDRRWAEFASELDLAFAGDLTDAAEVVYRAHLGGMDYDDARAALCLLVADGVALMPKPGELAAAAQRLERPPDPPWGEAWAAIVRALLADRPTRDLGAGAAQDAAAIERVGRELGEGAARFVASITPARLLAEPVDDPAIGGAVLARLGQEYERCCAAAREDRRVGLALEQARRAAVEGGRPGPRRLRAESARLRPG